MPQKVLKVSLANVYRDSNLSLSKSTEKYLTSHVSKDFYGRWLKSAAVVFRCLRAALPSRLWLRRPGRNGNVKHRNPSTSIQPHPIFIISTQGGEQRELPKTTMSMVYAWFTVCPSDALISSIAVSRRYEQASILPSSGRGKCSFEEKPLKTWSLSLIHSDSSCNFVVLLFSYPLMKNCIFLKKISCLYRA